MLEKFSRLAERAATNVSRRQMLGRLGYAAAAAVAALAGVFPSSAEAARPLGRGGFCTQCDYQCPDGSTVSITKRGRQCNSDHNGCRLVFSETVRCGSEG